MADWNRLLSAQRLDDILGSEATSPNLASQPSWLEQAARIPAERDYDRLRFAAPVRRLADKTQVFPLERNDSVRNRLTHSEEVSALARSVGTHLANVSLPGRGAAGNERAVPALLAAAGLAHDLGNPPFGHQGEAAIRHWFARRESVCFGDFDDAMLPSSAHAVEIEGARDMRAACEANHALRQDFLQFEGNAQTLRLVMRLQASTTGFGLNLTCASLASLMKYVVPSSGVAAQPAAAKKVGYFASEADWVKLVRTEVGLEGDMRHPLACVLEACDDIAYSVIDTEDSVKKGLVSFADLMGYLEAAAGEDEAVKYVVACSRRDHESARSRKLAPSELNDVSMQKFRVYAMNVLVSALYHAWEQGYEEVSNGTLEFSLLDTGPGVKLVKALKRFDFEHAFRHPDVLALEVDGFNKLQDLMSMLWRGIVEREHYTDPASKRTSPFADLAYRLISENYREAFERPAAGLAALPIRYRELQLLTDMVSGMTDSYAVHLHAKLSEYHIDASFRQV